MKLKPYILLPFVLILMVSCLCPESMYDDRVLVQWPTEPISQMVIDFSTELEHDRHLRFENSYIAQDSETGITKLRLEYSSQDILEVRDARMLLVDVAEGFLSRINNSPDVGMWMKPSPFTADQLEIYIDFQSFYDAYVDPFFVGWVVLENGMAYYYAYNVRITKFDFWHSRIEPYAKSRSYVEFERQAEESYQEMHRKPRSSLSDDRLLPNVSAPAPYQPPHHHYAY